MTSRAASMWLPEDGTQFAVRDFPPDATTGAAATANTLGTILLCGGQAAGAGVKTRLLDPRSMSDREVKELDAATPGAALERSAVFSLSKGRAVLVADEVDQKGRKDKQTVSRMSSLF